MRTFVLISMLAWIGVGAVDTVPELNVAQYLGEWYQTYASPIVMETFEKDGVCQTATYGVFNASTLTVFNNQRILTPTGENDDIYGYAYTTEEPGKLWVELGGGSPFPAPYWIVKLGPVMEYNGVEQYSYSVVSDPTLLFLFVLVRDIEEFEKNVEADLLVWLNDFGFDSVLNNPIKSLHTSECIYPWS